jgi:EAL domain-containing protein (putative c-di-GMP-specific phosphodiesterase class I)
MYGELEHKQELIRLNTRRLHELEKQKALQGNATPPAVSIEIEDINREIQQLTTNINQLVSQSKSLPTHRLRALPPPLQQYDPILDRLRQSLAQVDWRNGSYESDLLHCLANATRAEHTFILRHHPQPWQISTDNSASIGYIQTLIEEGSIARGLILEAISKNKPTVGYTPDSPKISLYVPLKEADKGRILILHNMEISFEPDLAIGQTIYALLRSTDNFKTRRSPAYIEAEIYNTLKRDFGYVSEDVYNRQESIFKERLDTMEVYFEPIISLSPYQVYLWGWEALARDPSTRQAPADLFQTAELWGKRFQLELDMYFVRKAISSYGPNRRLRSNEVMPISVNVYPVSLLRTKYLKTLQDIGYERKIPLDVLTLEISEKIPIPDLEEPAVHKDAMEAFLSKLKEIKKLHVKFAIDDFGVGYASSSRLSRIGPAFIKVDRDALLDPFGHLTIKYATDVAENLPGHIGVVVEGFDKDSKLSLLKLAELGVQYIQGHRVGEAIKIDTNAKLERINRLPEMTWNQLCQELGIIT